MTLITPPENVPYSAPQPFVITRNSSTASSNGAGRPLLGGHVNGVALLPADAHHDRNIRSCANARGHHNIDPIDPNTATREAGKLDLSWDAFDGDSGCGNGHGDAARQFAGGNRRGSLAEPVGVNRYRLTR